MDDEETTGPDQAGAEQTGAGDAGRGDPGWPPPHPSPPLPPPREYGSPGTPPARHPWAWAVVAAVVVGVLAAYGLVQVVRGMTDDEPAAADGGTTATDPATDSAGDPAGDPSPSGSESSSAPAEPAPYQCWDGTPAQDLSECSDPTGEEGLRWIFPAMADEKCSPATDGDSSADGMLLRVLCVHRLADGTRIDVGYFEWRSVEAGEAFYDDQGLTRTDVPGPDGKPVHHAYFGFERKDVKAATLFVDEPFSFTVTFPATVTLTPEDQEGLLPRTPDQLRGAPVG